MKNKLGTYKLGSENVNVFIGGPSGGSFNLSPKDGSIPFIELLLDGKDGSDILRVLMHEAFEFYCARHGLRFDTMPMRSDSHASYHFFMNHEQMDHAMYAISGFIAPVMIDIEKFLKVKTKTKK